MALSSLILSFFLSGQLFANPPLELLTKIDISKIRYLSSDGKVTYYQNNDGTLLFSSNYKVEPVLKQKKGTQFVVGDHGSRDFLTLEVFENFHRSYNSDSLRELFLLSKGSSKTQQLGSGLGSKIHPSTNWLSFFDPLQNALIYKNINDLEQTIKISLREKKSPYFIPQTVMVSRSKILYTKTLKDKSVALILRDLDKKKDQQIYKAQNEARRIEICRINEHFYMGDFPLDLNQKGSTILKGYLNKATFELEESPYSSNLSDLGNMLCHLSSQSLYWISDSKKGTSNVLSLKVKDKKPKKLTSFKSLSNIFAMDKKILSAINGKIYVLKGESDMTKQDLLLK